MGKKLDLKGKRFNRLVVLYDSGKRLDGRVVWICQCDCGNITQSPSRRLINRNNQSCGCLRKENCKKMGKIKKHGDARLRLYRTWAALKVRCYNQDLEVSKSYIKKGIQVCPEWKENYKSFKFWAILNGYQDDLVIDRINNKGNYEPSNCRWITIQEHGRKSALEKFEINV